MKTVDSNRPDFTTWPFPVLYRVVRGATPEKVVLKGAAGLLPDFIEAAQELVVGGFTDPQGKRVGLGALLIGYYDGDDFAFAGKIGTGFDTKQLLDLRTRLDALAVEAAPFTKGKGLPRHGHWVRPEIVVQIGFIEWTVHGKLRHPRLLGVRTDKNPRDVVREPS